MSNLRRLCIYHGDCTDGVAAAWAYWHAHRTATFYPGVHGQLPPFEGLSEYDIISMVDFSYRADVVKHMQTAAPDAVIEVLDHHASAEKELRGMLDSGEIVGEIDMERSGALVTWDRYHEGQTRPPLMRYIDARDRWVKDASLNHDLDHVTFGLRATAGHGFPINFDEWSVVMNDVGFLARQGKPIATYHANLVEQAKKEAVDIKLNCATGNYGRVPCVNTSYALASDVGNDLALASESRMAVMWWMQADRRVCVSLRSAPDGPDVSEIARDYGGGGHVHAAGFKVREFPWEWVE